MARRNYAGGAVITTLASGISAVDLSITLSSSTGWPTGGANGEFFVTIDADLPGEERILVASRSGSTLTIANTGKRGVDGTAATSHATGATIIHSFSGIDADEANRHVNDTTLDEHTQYMATDGTRHDLTARHSAGTVVPTAAPVPIGTALAEGTGTNAARATHVHTIGTGAVNASTMFAANVVDAAAIAAGAVGSSELATGAVTAGKIASGAINASGLFTAGVVDAAAIATNAVGSSELADNAVDTAALIALAVTADKIGLGAPTSYAPTFGGFVTPVSPFGHYYKLGRLVVGWAGVTVGAGGVTSSITVSLPVANGGGFEGMLAARARQPGGSAGGSGIGVIADGTSLGVNITTIGAAEWGNNVPMGWTLNSTMRCVFLYVSA